MTKSSKQFWLGGLVGSGTMLLMLVAAYMINQSAVAMPYQQGGLSVKWLPQTVRLFEKEIENQARRYNLDADLVAIIMTLESGGYTKADSGVARGLMQVTPPTAGEIASKHLKQSVRKYDLFDAPTSIEFGVAYLNYLRNMMCDYQTYKYNSGNCAELMAAGYNGGPGVAVNLLRGEGVGAIETLIYSRNVRDMWRERQAEKSPTYKRWLEAGGQLLIDKAKREQK